MRIHWKSFWNNLIRVRDSVWMPELMCWEMYNERVSVSHENTFYFANITHPIRNENLTIHLSNAVQVKLQAERLTATKRREQEKNRWLKEVEVEVTMKNSILSRIANAFAVLFRFFATYFFGTECCQSTFSLEIAV